MKTGQQRTDRKWNCKREQPDDGDGGEHLARCDARPQWKHDGAEPVDAEANQGEGAEEDDDGLCVKLSLIHI